MPSIRIPISVLGSRHHHDQLDVTTVPAEVVCGCMAGFLDGRSTYPGIFADNDYRSIDGKPYLGASFGSPMTN